MRNIVGLVMFGFGFWLAWSAFAQRQRVIAARAAGTIAREGEAGGNEQLSMMGEIMRPIILFALVYLAAKSVFAYVMLEGHQWVSYFDMAGYLFLLAAYGWWVVVRTKYREIAAATPAVAPPAAAPPEPVREVPRPAPARVPETVA
jgi:hypothetical protein